MLSEAFLASLRSLRLHSPRRRVGSTTGERRSIKRGRSVEFADYRNYTPGDDPRRVDWNVYARLERPYIKLFEDEEDLTTHLLVDTSPSMHWRDEDEEVTSSKWQRIAELVTALGYVTLASGDKLIVEANNGQRYGPKRSGAAMADLVKFVEQLSTPQSPNSPNLQSLNLQRSTANAQRSTLNTWLKRYALDARPGLCILISDMLDEQGYADGLNALGSARLDVNVLHTLCPAELDPSFVGDLKLKDIETAAVQDMSMDDVALNQYRDRLETWTSEIAAFCRKRGGKYHRTDTSLPIEQILLRDLRKEEWLI